MATTTNKQRTLTQLFTSLKKAYEAGEQEARPILEQFIYGLCHENATKEQADLAYANLRSQFFDWNEVRVSSLHEIEEAISHLSDSGARAERIVAFLQEVFESTFSFDLEAIHKKTGGLKETTKKLAKYQAANDYVIAWVTQQSLGGHAIPIDQATMRVTKRLGLVDGDTDDLETMRTSLEHLVPKAKGADFTELVSLVANKHCLADGPRCNGCPLSGDCPTAQQEPVGVGASSERPVRAKPR